MCSPSRDFFLSSKVCSVLIPVSPFWAYGNSYSSGVARAVLKTSLSLIHSLSRSSFSSKSSIQIHSQIVWDMVLKFWENVHFPPCVTCHVSHLIWEISARAGIDCYWIGDFLVFPEAYKYGIYWRKNPVLLCMCQFV